MSPMNIEYLNSGRPTNHKSSSLIIKMRRGINRQKMKKTHHEMERGSARGRKRKGKVGVEERKTRWSWKLATVGESGRVGEGETTR